MYCDSELMFCDVTDDELRSFFVVVVVVPLEMVVSGDSTPLSFNCFRPVASLAVFSAIANVFCVNCCVFFAILAVSVFIFDNFVTFSPFSPFCDVNFFVFVVIVVDIVVVFSSFDFAAVFVFAVPFFLMGFVALSFPCALLAPGDWEPALELRVILEEEG